ncbi:hypothetical protein INR49_000886 [Caranx melampygus]|nr:hypothetical protein INR49_000886 [Caranx melampygus]
MTASPPISKEEVLRRLQQGQSTQRRGSSDYAFLLQQTGLAWHCRSLKSFWPWKEEFQSEPLRHIKKRPGESFRCPNVQIRHH